MVSKAKDEDMRKRRHLQQFYSKTKACLDKLDDTALSVLNKNFGNVKDAVMTNQNRLTRQQYYVLVAGMQNTILILVVIVYIEVNLIACATLAFCIKSKIYSQ